MSKATKTISLSKLSGETVLITKNNITHSRSYRMCFVTGVVTADNLNRPKLIVSPAFVFLFNLDCRPTCCFRIARRFARLAYFQCVDFFKQFYYVGLTSVDIRARQYIARIWYIQAYTVYIGIYIDIQALYHIMIYLQDLDPICVKCSYVSYDSYDKFKPLHVRGKVVVDLLNPFPGNV